MESLPVRGTQALCPAVVLRSQLAAILGSVQPFVVRDKVCAWWPAHPAWARSVRTGRFSIVAASCKDSSITTRQLEILPLSAGLAGWSASLAG